MTDKPRPSADDLRSALFYSYVAPYVEGATWDDPQKRKAAMLARLEQLMLTMGDEEQDPTDEWSVAPSMAHVVLRLLASDGLGWVMAGVGHRVRNEPHAGDPDGWKGKERELLILLLDEALGGQGVTAEALDVVPALLPRWLAERLRNNLVALDMGEIRPLLMPAGTGKSGRWTKLWRRGEVLQHIWFLNGQGQTIERATEILAKAIGVSVDTIDKWREESRRFYERESLDSVIKACKAAGEYKVLLSNDPGHGNDAEHQVGGRALQIFLDMEDEPLSAFARRFKRENAGEKAQRPRKGKPVKGTKSK